MPCQLSITGDQKECRERRQSQPHYFCNTTTQQTCRFPTTAVTHGLVSGAWHAVLAAAGDIQHTMLLQASACPCTERGQASNSLRHARACTQQRDSVTGSFKAAVYLSNWTGAKRHNTNKCRAMSSARGTPSAAVDGSQSSKVASFCSARCTQHAQRLHAGSCAAERLKDMAIIAQQVSWEQCRHLGVEWSLCGLVALDEGLDAAQEAPLACRTPCCISLCTFCATEAGGARAQHSWCK